MKKIIELLKRFDKWLSDEIYGFYPNLTKHMKDKK